MKNKSPKNLVLSWFLLFWQIISRILYPPSNHLLFGGTLTITYDKLLHLSFYKKRYEIENPKMSDWPKYRTECLYNFNLSILWILNELIIISLNYNRNFKKGVLLLRKLIFTKNVTFNNQQRTYVLQHYFQNIFPFVVRGIKTWIGHCYRYQLTWEQFCQV